MIISHLYLLLPINRHLVRNNWSFALDLYLNGLLLILTHFQHYKLCQFVIIYENESLINCKCNTKQASYIERDRKSPSLEILIWLTSSFSPKSIWNTSCKAKLSKSSSFPSCLYKVEIPYLFIKSTHTMQFWPLLASL